MSIIQSLRKEKMGFVSKPDLPLIIEEKPLQLLLVRCGCGRFLTPAQDCQHFMDIIRREASDHVRDVSLPAAGF